MYMYMYMYVYTCVHELCKWGEERGACITHFPRKYIRQAKM